MARAHSTLESCAHDTDKCLWYINDGETEMLIIHAKDHILLSSFISFKWPLNCSLLASAKNIGVVLNSMLSLDNHITQICKSSFYST